VCSNTGNLPLRFSYYVTGLVLRLLFCDEGNLLVDYFDYVSCRNARALSLVHIILNDIVHYTLSTLRNIQKSLLYWESIAEVFS
jgi:hypothetical protein